MTNVYDQKRKAFSDIAAYAIADQYGNIVATVSIKRQARTTAYVHYLGELMQKGVATGGGYDKDSFAVADAIGKMHTAFNYDGIENPKAPVLSFLVARDAMDSRHWYNCFPKGWQVQQVI